VGPDRLLVDYVRIVMLSDPTGEVRPSILLKAVTPFQEDGEPVQYMLASPRYTDDTVEQEIDLGRTVGVARIRPGLRINDLQTIPQAAAVDLLIGRLKFLPAVQVINGHSPAMALSQN